MAFIYYQDNEKTPYVKLLCGCKPTFSKYLWSIFNNKTSAYVVAVNVMHYRHSHTKWDNVYPLFRNEKVYRAMKLHYNFLIKVQLLDLMRKHNVMYLEKGFKYLQEYKVTKTILNTYVKSVAKN